MGNEGNNIINRNDTFSPVLVQDNVLVYIETFQHRYANFQSMCISVFLLA